MHGSTLVLTLVFCCGFYNYRATCYWRNPSANFCSLKLHYWGLFALSLLESFKLVAPWVLQTCSNSGYWVSRTFFCSYSSKTVEAERISVDHVAHLKPSDGGSAATQCEWSYTSVYFNLGLNLISTYCQKEEYYAFICTDMFIMREIWSWMQWLLTLREFTVPSRCWTAGSGYFTVIFWQCKMVFSIFYYS